IDVRYGDTQHGGDQTVTVSALFGVNAADDRGNIMLGIERNTRSKELQYERDWRLEDYANPNTAGGFFAFGSATWFHNEPGTAPANPSQAAVDALFNPATGSCAYPNTLNLANNVAPPGTNPLFFTPITVDDNPATLCQISNNLTLTNFRIN